MPEIIKQKLISIAESLHLRIFGHETGEEMRKFLEGKREILKKIN